MRRPSDKIRKQVRKVFEDNPTRGYKPAELVERVGLQASTVAMAAWDLIDSGELFISTEKEIKLTPHGSVDAPVSV